MNLDITYCATVECAKAEFCLRKQLPRHEDWISVSDFDCTEDYEHFIEREENESIDNR